LGIVLEKPGDLAKAMNRTSAKIKAPTVGLGYYVDVEVTETVVPIKVEPLEYDL
jgi:hypothetical protein